MASKNAYSFLSCFVQSRDVFRIVCQIDELKKMGSTSSRLLKYVRSESKVYVFDLDWHATRVGVLTVPELTLIAVGPSGIVGVGTSKGTSEEEIDPTNNGPKRRGDIRDLRIIGADVYASGMSRQVYRRVRTNQWLHEDAGTVQPRGATEVVGFNAIDGLASTEIYAVGFGGEIWLRRNGQWAQSQSPTNVILHRVRVVRPGLVYVCGQEGVLLRGHGDQWTAIEHEATSENLWGMEWFKDHLYLASDDGLFRLDPDDNVVRVETGIDEATFRHLHAADGVLLSSGSKHVLFTEDGSTWVDITP